MQTTAEDLLDPRPSYGVLVWAGFLALSVFSGPHVFFIQIVCYAGSLAACVWWFVISRKRVRRGFLRRALGYIAFAFGSMMPLSGALIVVLGRATPLFILSLVIAVGLIAGAHYLVFRRDKLAKSLPLKQVQEIFAVLRNLEAMAHQLGQDAERGSRELSANSGDQFLRRNLVRIFAAFVEGYSFVFKQVVLRLHDPLQEQLSIEELSKLKEIKLDATGQPVLDEQGLPKRRFLPLHDNFKFAVAMFRRLCGSKYAVSYGSAGYEAFRRTISVRDRLMHPKTIEDLHVRDNETLDLQAAWQWYQTEMVTLGKDSIVAMNERFAALLKVSPASPKT